ncbi:hypothetical protein T06_7451, partial [Trichinella sp. T6]
LVEAKRVELHAFCDASELAYGAVIYLRVETSAPLALVSLVTAKTRVASIKRLSLPRLKLMGALVVARLVHYTEVALSWVRSAASRWKPFVRNRVEEIQQLVEPASWRHCSGKDNPADWLSRGVTVTKLAEGNVWWHGLTWLARPQQAWPRRQENHERNPLIPPGEERTSKHATCALMTVQTTEEPLHPAVNPKPSSSLTFAAEQVKPPRVPLPKFDGDILQFKSFGDQFESSIHQQKGLNDITKLLHLRSCLSGSALKAIEGVTICAENYPEIVQTLNTRFYRIPDVVESHVLSVMNVKACSNEGAGELTRLHDDLNRHFLELKALGKDVNCGLSGFHVILPTLTRKLPSGTVTEWETFVKNKKDDKIHSDEPYHNARKPDLRFTTAAVQMEPGGGCPVCKGDHLADCCPRFRSYSVQQRRHWAMQLKL